MQDPGLANTTNAEFASELAPTLLADSLAAEPTMGAGGDERAVRDSLPDQIRDGLQAEEAGIRLAIVTDAWHPQVNGVVTTLQAVIDSLRTMGYTIEVIEPSAFRTMP